MGVGVGSMGVGIVSGVEEGTAEQPAKIIRQRNDTNIDFINLIFITYLRLVYNFVVIYTNSLPRFYNIIY